MAFRRYGLAFLIAFTLRFLSPETKNTPGLEVLKLHSKMTLSRHSTVIGFFFQYESLTQYLTCLITSTVSTTCDLTLHETQDSANLPPTYIDI